jgi:hypothetical protein
VIVIDADALAVLEAVPAYAAGVALVGQELVEPLLGQVVTPQLVHLTPPGLDI